MAGRGKKHRRRQEGWGKPVQECPCSWGGEPPRGACSWQEFSQLQLSRGAAASRANPPARPPARSAPAAARLGLPPGHSRGPTEPLSWLVLLGSGQGARAKLRAAGEAVGPVPGGRRDAKHQVDFLLCCAMPHRILRILGAT